MIRNYFKIAWRNLIRNKLYSSINIFGLALGMAVTIIIGLWITDELNFNDYFLNKNKIAQVYQTQTWNGNMGTGNAIPLPLEKALKDKYGDNFKSIVMSSWTNEEYLKYGEKSISRTGNYMQEAAPEMLSLKIIKGKKNGLQEPNSLMISASTAKALFGNADPLGKTVSLNSTNDMKVTAVYKDIPQNNTFFDVQYIAPWKFYVNSRQWIKNSMDNWSNNSFQLFVQIAENASMEQVSDKIIDLKKNASEDTRPYNPQLTLLPMSAWHLRSEFKNGKQVGGRIENVWLFGIIGLFVLLLACINFMNLSTARSEHRALEVGIRKTIGSSRGQLVYQFMSESILVVLFAFVIAVILVFLSLSGFNDLAKKEIEFPWGNLQFWLFSLIFIAVTAFISGSYPALYLSSFKPIKVLKGTFKMGRFSALPRKVLVVTQFTVSVALIIGTLIVLQQIKYSKDRPVGYDRNGLIQIPALSNEFASKFDIMQDQLKNSGAVDEMSTSSSPVTEIYSNQSGFTWEGKPPGFQEDLAWTYVSTDYVKSLNMKIIEGRDFSREFATDSNAVLLNQTAVAYMGLKNPVGMYLRDTDEKDPAPPLQIIGVVEDVVTQSPYEPIKQGVYSFDKYGSVNYYNLRLNPNSSMSQNLALVEKAFKANFPNLPFQYQFIDEQYAQKFASEEQIANLARIFTILAILISCLGLFGLASFVAEQRNKEIGVRKILGATVANVWLLLSKDFLLLVVIALLIASPLAYYFMQGWIEKFSYRTSISVWIFIAAWGGAVFITMITVSFQAIKAAIANPVKSLRTE